MQQEIAPVLFVNYQRIKKENDKFHLTENGSFHGKFFLLLLPNFFERDKVRLHCNCKEDPENGLATLQCRNFFESFDLLLLKSALSGLRHFLATESPLKMMKNAVYFTSKALFVLKIYKF